MLSDLLVHGQVLEHRAGYPFRITGSEHLEQRRMGLSAPAMFFRLGIQPSESQPDVALTGMPQPFESAQIPARGSRPQQVQVERMVGRVDLIDTQALIPEHLHRLFQPGKVALVQQLAGTPRDLGLDLAAEPVDTS